MALFGIGIAHAVVNARGFAQDHQTSWLIFLLLGPGIGVLAIGIGVVAWRFGGRTGPVARIVVTIGAVLLCVTAFNVLRSNPAVAWIPLGPGPWAIIGGPALLVAVLSSKSSLERKMGPVDQGPGGGRTLAGHGQLPMSADHDRQ